jgi:CRP-like cAMP-binding protein
MLDRIAETTDALLPGAGEPPELRAPETSFRFLDRRQLRELLKLAHRRSYEPGAVIISAGDRAEAMYLVVEGTVVVVDRSTPDVPPVSTLWPGEVFGELSFLGAVPSKSVVAVDHVLLDALDGDIVHAVLAADVPLAAAFYRSLAVLVARRLNQDSGTAGWLVPVDPASS